MVLKNRSNCPPDGFRYVHSETGYESKAIDPYTWFENIRAHRKANNLVPITLEQAESQLCETLPPGWCQHPVTERHSFVSTRLRWREIAEATKAYLTLLITGETASQAEADRRARICSGCYLRVVPQGCGTCVKLARLVTGAIALKKTPYDSNLVNRACAVCRCPASSIVHFPMSVLDGASSPEKQEAYPEFCWAKQGGVNYQAA